jgi:hypothetical protein
MLLFLFLLAFELANIAEDLNSNLDEGDSCRTPNKAQW